MGAGATTLAGRSRVIRASARRGGDVDLALLGVFGALLAGGVVMVASASAPGGGLLARHLSALAVALGAGVMAFWVRTEFWRRAAPLLMLAALALLALVLAVGIDVNGSRRWLAVGALRVQPSELAKLCIVVFTAAFIARHPRIAQPLPVAGDKGGGEHHDAQFRHLRGLHPQPAHRQPAADAAPINAHRQHHRQQPQRRQHHQLPRPAPEL